MRIDELRAGKTIISERWRICNDGTFLPVEIGAKMFPDERLQGIVRYITARNRAQRRFHELLKESPAMHVITQNSNGFRILAISIDPFLCTWHIAASNYWISL